MKEVIEFYFFSFMNNLNIAYFMLKSSANKYNKSTASCIQHNITILVQSGVISR